MRKERTDRIKPLLYLPLLLALAALPACGGGGGGGGGTPGPQPPLSLSYDDAAPVYRTDGPIVANNPTTTGGAPDDYSVVPALPNGLVLDPATGVISGNPTAPAPMTAHTVTAANTAGSVDALVNVEVKWVDFKSIDPVASVTDADIRYFLERTHFGFHQTQYDAINLTGLGPYLDTTLAAIGPTGTVALETAADTLIGDINFPEEEELSRWWLYCIQESPNPLQESLALHWHDHFACSTDVLGDQSHWWYLGHMDLVRHNAAGNLRDIAIDISRDRAMLEYLDGRDSTKNQPNENYGREFLELFFLGVNNGYDQADIVAAAALFSGYRRTFDGSQDQITWTPGQHNDQDQTFLGVNFTGVTNPPTEIFYPQVVDTTFAHKPPGDTIGYASRWIIRSMLRRYCYENPAQELIDQLAALLESSNWELTPVIKTLFLSEAFYSSLARAGFVKTPVEHLLGFVHLTGLKMPLERNGTYNNTQGLDRLLRDLGNRISQPPVVDGWPEGESWFSAQGMVDRANVLNELITQRDYQTDNGFDITGLLPSPTATAQELVTAMGERFQITFTPAENTTLVDYLNTDDTGSTTNEPWDPTKPTHLDSRLRGLLYIIAQHPQHLLR